MALYDLSVDPVETIDGKEDHPDVIQQLKALANTYSQDLGDDLIGIKETGRRGKGVLTECVTNYRKPR